MIRAVLKTKDFDTLLGTSGSAIEPQGEQSIGAQQELWPIEDPDPDTMSDQSCLYVAESVAESVNRPGDQDSTLQLYYAAGMKGNVMTIDISILSCVPTSRDSQSSAKVFINTAY